MSQEVPKHELLLKLLKMTASNNDAEALVAIRKANALLASAAWDWDKLLSGKITVVGDPFGNLQRPEAKAPVAPSAYAQPPRHAPPRPAAPRQPDFTQQRASAQANMQSRRTRKPTVAYDDIFGAN